MKQPIQLITLFLLINFILPYSQMFGQDYDQTDYTHRKMVSNPIISPPPTASSLGKYAEIPVSQYTGVPNISIPLYEIKAHNGYTLPVSLSYHASGIKVQERAGNVGIGWSLNAGGVITRIVKGHADDQDTTSSNSDYHNWTSAGKLFHPGEFITYQITRIFKKIFNAIFPPLYIKSYIAHFVTITPFPKK